MNDRETADYYRARAQEYEQIYFRDIPERRKEIDDEASRLRTLVTGKNVLELACGTGYWTKVMAETAAHITAIDLWPEMIAVAKKKTLRAPVDFIAADMFTHPLAENSYDFIAVGFWFSHQPKQEYEKFFALITKPLKTSSPMTHGAMTNGAIAKDATTSDPMAKDATLSEPTKSGSITSGPIAGGAIWMIENNPPAEGGKGHELVNHDEFGNSYKRRHLEDGSPYVILKNYFDESELRALFAPRFTVQSLVYKKYYWSVVLTLNR